MPAKIASCIRDTFSLGPYLQQWCRLHRLLWRKDKEESIAAARRHARMSHMRPRDLGRQPRWPDITFFKTRLSRILPSNCLQFQKLVQAGRGIESPKPGLLDAAVRDVCFIVNGHVVDMNSPWEYNVSILPRYSSTSVITHPDSMPLATLKPLPRSSVKTEAARPYSVSFANSRASSSVSNEYRLTVGPKLS